VAEGRVRGQVARNWRGNCRRTDRWDSPPGRGGAKRRGGLRIASPLSWPISR